MADHVRSELALDAVGMAIATRKPPAGTVHHTDRGSTPHTEMHSHRTAVRRRSSSWLRSSRGWSDWSASPFCGGCSLTTVPTGAGRGRATSWRSLPCTEAATALSKSVRRAPSNASNQWVSSPGSLGRQPSGWTTSPTRVAISLRWRT